MSRQVLNFAARSAVKSRSLIHEAAMVGGHWVTASTSTKTIPVYNPANCTLVGHVPLLDASHVQQAINSAKSAQIEWANENPRKRGLVLEELHSLILTNQSELAELIREEAGKTMPDALAEVNYAASFVKFYAEEAKRVQGEILSTPLVSQRGLVIKQAVGVVAAITPWNFPLAMVTRKVAPALAAGCSIVLKPSEITPFSSIAFCKLAQQASLPSGLFSVVTGDASEVAGEFIASEDVRKLTFTGSTRVGKLLMGQCASTVKNLSLELGGNAPFIVFDDADLDKAVSELLSAKLRANGQICIAPNRILVDKRVALEFGERLSTSVSKLVVGDPLDDRSDIGPLINADASEKAHRHLADALNKGAVVNAEATSLEGCQLGRNYFVPTVITGVSPDMLVMQEETFAPLFAISTFSSEAEVVQISNNTPVGLAAYVYTRDVARLFRVSEAIEAGMIGANSSSITSELAPFGGIKQSGLGREAGKHGLEEYLEKKYIALGL